MGWLRFKEINEDSTQETQDNNSSQIPQSSSVAGNSNSDSSGAEYVSIDNETGINGESGSST